MVSSHPQPSLPSHRHPPPLPPAPPSLQLTGRRRHTYMRNSGGPPSSWRNEQFFTVAPGMYSGAESGGEIEESDILLDVPSSLAPIVLPFLTAASEIEQENPRVAYLCRDTALDKALDKDPHKTGRGVRQFATKLGHRLEKNEAETKRRLASTDHIEVSRFFEVYCRKHLEGHLESTRDEMARHYQTASVLYDVLKNTAPPDFLHFEFGAYLKSMEKKTEPLHYNILPLNIPGSTEPVMKIPEIEASVELLRRIDNLPMPKTVDPNSTSHDLFDWLGQKFGFQKSNVENQKEHLILLLANIKMGKWGVSCQGERYNPEMLGTAAVYLMKKLFQNYTSWCRYLDLAPSIIIPNDASTQQLELLYIGLYLLIWGEASNIRFMPECLCYIFHHMAKELSSILSDARDGSFDASFRQVESDDLFLRRVIQPIYIVIQKEAATSKHGAASHGKWRNYEDLNEYFWTKKCFKQLGWPMEATADFFVEAKRTENEIEKHDTCFNKRRISKTNFVEVRSFWHLFRSFNRMWAFFILAFQAMVIIAWSPSRSLFAIFEPVVFRNVLTIFITAAFLNFLQATLEIVLNWKAWRSLGCSQRIRYILKFILSIAWLIVLPTTYSSFSTENPTSIDFVFSNLTGHLKSQSTYNSAIAIYMLPNILSALGFIFAPLLRILEHSKSRTFRFLFWWTQTDLYIARGMHEDTFSLIKYTSFWILLLICKLVFSFYVEICPLVGATRTIMFMGRRKFAWHKLFPYSLHTLGVLISMWAPVVMVYFIDTQIWFTIFSAICGGVNGTFRCLGKIRTLEMLRLRFEAIPRAFGKKLRPKHDRKSKGYDNKNNQFSDVWNAFISSLRDEDLISNRERNLLIVPSSAPDRIASVSSSARHSSIRITSGFQWPPFLLASMIPTAVDSAKRVKSDVELRTMINQDPYMYYAVVECYNTMLEILYSLVEEPRDRKVVQRIHEDIEDCIRRQSIVEELRLGDLPQLSAKFDKMLTVLLHDEDEYNDTVRTQISNLLQDIMEIFTRDIMKNGESILKDDHRYEQLFSQINVDIIKDKAWRDKCVRLQLLLTMKESTTYVPTNLEARRRILFFGNSLFMKMPKAPPVHNMMSISVLTPYFKEEVLFSAEDLQRRNGDGISVLSYLQTIYADEWNNFLERIKFKPMDDDSLRLRMEDIRPWASYRGQTLTRTVRGMMYYRRALEIQCIQDRTYLAELESSQVYDAAQASAVADIKFTYVVSCPLYGMQKKSKDVKDKACCRNILNLLITYPSLRVAYMDEVEAPTKSGTIEMNYFSVLVKGVGDKYDEEIYRIKLPGKPIDIGDGRDENLNHALIFTRGEALQAININQDNYLEEAFKMRNVLEEFGRSKYGKRKPTILGLRENNFIGRFSSLAGFVSNKENSFTTIEQRVLTQTLKVRFHYGNPDIFDRLFHVTRGGISKASNTINLSEDIFSCFNSAMRGGNVTHQEYMQLGKLCDVGMNQISSIEAQAANRSGEQTLSRHIYRLGQRFDFYRMLSLYFTTIGFYFSSMITILTVYVFLYGRLFLVMSGLEKSMLVDPCIQESIRPLQNALATQAIFELDLMLFLPVVMEICLEKGFLTALQDFVIMQLQLATMYFTFQLGTKAHYYGRTILHGSCAYRPYRGLVVYRAKFSENYRMYARSHFGKGLELLILLVVYEACGHSCHSTKLNIFVTFSMWFLVASWLLAPFIFNPSCFDRQKAVDDWVDWREWMGKRGGMGMSTEQSWEAWWISEQEHLRKTSCRGLLLEIILSLRFLIYQFCIVYYLNPTHGSSSKRIPVYALSWLLTLAVLSVLKIFSVERQRYRTGLQLMFRLIESLIFLALLASVAILFAVCKIKILDFLASILGFIPAGWCLLLIGQACSPLVKKATMWDPIMELGRAYDYAMGFVLYLPIRFFSLFSFISEFQNVLLFNQASRRGIQISRIVAGK